jgi:hypothetical protein
MATINQLTSVDTPSGSDLVPIYSSSNGDTRKLSLTNLAAWILNEINTTISTTNYDSPFVNQIPMVVGVAQAAQRSVGILCTVAGNVNMQLSSGGTIIVPVLPGWQTFPFACTEILSSGTTATASYYNLV